MTKKIDDELLDEVGRHVANRLDKMISKLPSSDPSHYSQSGILQFATRTREPIEGCSFCGGAGFLEREIEDSTGTTLIITIDCPH